MENLGDQLQVFTVLQTTTKTATDTGGTSVDLNGISGEIAVILNAAHGSGNSDNTLVVKLQGCDDNSTWADISGAVFTSVNGTTDSTQKLSLNSDEIPRYIRELSTIAGTTPSFRYGIVAVGVKQNPA